MYGRDSSAVAPTITRGVVGDRAILVAFIGLNLAGVDDDDAMLLLVGYRAIARTNTGRARWFPLSCFDLTGQDSPVLVRIIPRDASAEGSRGTIEVEVELSDGQRRWCFIVTLEGLSHLTQAQPRTARLFMYGAPHMIVVNAISHDVIDEVLHYLDSQNELIACTLPIPIS